MKYEREIIRIVDVNPNSIRVIWIKVINANVPLPLELEFVKPFRNRVPVRHYYQHHKGDGVMACGTKYTTGNFVVETTCESDVNCKRCLKQLQTKNTFLDVLVMRTTLPMACVTVKDTGERYITSKHIGKHIIIDDDMFEQKLKNSIIRRQGWFVEVHRLNRISQANDIRNLKEKFL